MITSYGVTTRSYVFTSKNEVLGCSLGKRMLRISAFKAYNMHIPFILGQVPMPDAPGAVYYVFSWRTGTDCPK
jgi:hypothetical protein